MNNPLFLNLERPAIITQYFGEENDIIKKCYMHGAASLSRDVYVGHNPYNAVTRKISTYI